jgi:hypothetical protein
MNHSPLCVYTSSLKVSLLREVGSIPPLMATEKTLKPLVWSFIGIMLGLSSCYGLLWSITLNMDSPIGRMEVVLVWHLVTASVIIAKNLTFPIALLSS